MPRCESNRIVVGIFSNMSSVQGVKEERLGQELTNVEGWTAY